MIFIAFACLLLLLREAQRFARKQKELYEPHLATVLEISETGRSEGGLKECEVKIEIAGQEPRRATVRQWMDPEHPPRLGQVVRVVSQDGVLVLFGFTAEPAEIVLPRTAHPAPPEDSAEDDALVAAELTPELCRQGRLFIATVLDARGSASGRTRFCLEIDAIGQRPRTAELDQFLPAMTYNIGERVYLLVDPADSGVMHLLAPSEIGGQRLPKEMNRLDPYVLGPELLRNGARARGTVLSAIPVPLGPEYEVRGFHRFRLTFRIEPETDVPPYEAEQTITLTRPEKIRAMATPGAVVPLRFDALNPETFGNESLAMGYGDPYAEALDLFREQLRGAGPGWQLSRAGAGAA